MNAVYVLILGLIVVFLGYRVYAKYIDEKVIQADPKRVHSGQNVHGWRGVHAHPQEHTLWVSIQIHCGRGAHRRPDHRDSMGLVARRALDTFGGIFHRLGA